MSLCGSGTRNSHSDQFYVLVCLGQDAQLFGPARCYRGHEALEDAANIKPADDLVLCRWASTSRLKPLEKESFLREQTFCLQKSLWTQDCGTSCFQGQFSVFPCGSQACQLPILQKPTPTDISLSVLSYVTTPSCFP